MKVTRQERLRLIRSHPEKSSSELADLLGVSKRSIERDRAKLAQESEPKGVEYGDDAIGNLKAQRQRLEVSLKAAKVGSEVHRKLMKDLANLELAIAKLVSLRPIAESTEYLFVAFADSDGIARCQHISRFSPERQAEIRERTDKLMGC